MFLARQCAEFAAVHGEDKLLTMIFVQISKASQLQSEDSLANCAGRNNHRVNVY